MYIGFDQKIVEIPVADTPIFARSLIPLDVSLIHGWRYSLALRRGGDFFLLHRPLLTEIRGLTPKFLIRAAYASTLSKLLSEVTGNDKSETVTVKPGVHCVLTSRPYIVEIPMATSRHIYFLAVAQPGI